MPFSGHAVNFQRRFTSGAPGILLASVYTVLVELQTTAAPGLPPPLPCKATWTTQHELFLAWPHDHTCPYLSEKQFTFQPRIFSWLLLPILLSLALFHQTLLLAILKLLSCHWLYPCLLKFWGHGHGSLHFSEGSLQVGPQFSVAWLQDSSRSLAAWESPQSCAHLKKMICSMAISSLPLSFYCNILH